MNSPLNPTRKPNTGTILQTYFHPEISREMPFDILPRPCLLALIHLSFILTLLLANLINIWSLDFPGLHVKNRNCPEKPNIPWIFTPQSLIRRASYFFPVFSFCWFHPSLLHLVGREAQSQCVHASNNVVLYNSFDYLIVLWCSLHSPTLSVPQKWWLSILTLESPGHWNKNTEARSQP